MNKTKIEWCDATVNPVVGCTFGCPFCYARRLNQRFGFVTDFSKPQFFPERLKQLESKKPKNIFMDSMSDIADWEEEWINEIADAIKNNPQHNYMFLTKRMERIYFDSRFESLLFCKNIWLGISVKRTLDLGDDFKALQEFQQIDVNTFISIEPIHGWVDFVGLQDYLQTLDWIIIGAETGNRKEKVIPKKEWIDKIVIQANVYNIPIFMKDSLIPIVGEENMRREFPKELLHNDFS